MPAFGTQPLPSPPNLWIGCRLSLGAAISRATGGPATGVSPWSDAGNTLIAAPFFLEAPLTTFYKGWWWNGSSAGGNSEVAIYDEGYNLLATTGSVAGVTNSVEQAASLTTTVTLSPGRYYMGMAHSTTTTQHLTRFSAATVGIAHWQGLGCWRQAGITMGALPSPATPGSITNIAMPAFGLITRSVFDL